MTANKNFKRRVRDRARRTGESYTAALRHLRPVDDREQPVRQQWQRVEKSDFGYAIHLPEGWEERPPNLKNSPWETARFNEPGDRRHGLIVFRHPVRPGRDAFGVAEVVQPTLEASGFGDFQITPATVAGRPGARLDCAKYDAGRVYAVREFMLVQDGVHFCVGCGSAMPDEDEELFVTVANRLELLDAG